MARRSKRMRAIDAMVDKTKRYTLKEAIEKIQSFPPTKFDQSVDIALHLGVDAKKADQVIRGTVSLPHGTGKLVRVLVFAKGDKVKEALQAGAEFAGADELLEKVKGGWIDFDVIIATPDMMRSVGTLGKVLGPRGLMPTPKGGTVTNDVASAVREIKKGKVEFKLDKFCSIHNPVGKVSFSATNLVENIQTFLVGIVRAKPSSSKGQYVLAMTLSPTMGAGLPIDLREIPTI